MWDLALSNLGDLVIAGNGDLAGQSGDNLVSQRIKIRLKVPKGGWVYDEDEDFGSLLRSTIGKQADENAIATLVRDALQPMGDVVIDDVQVTAGDDASVSILVTYSSVIEPGDAAEPLLSDEATTANIVVSI